MSGTLSFLIYNSQFETVSLDTDYRHMICLGFALAHFNHFSFFFSVLDISFASDPIPRQQLTQEGADWVSLSRPLHGLSAQQISRQQGVNGGGAPDHAGVLSVGRPPQAGVLGDSAPQQVAPAGLAPTAAATATAPLANRVGLGVPAHPILIASWVGVPARGGCPQRLALCKEAVDVLLPGELCQDGGVSKHTPSSTKTSNYYST